MTCKKQLESKLNIINNDKLRLGVKKLKDLQILSFHCKINDIKIIPYFSDD